MQSIKLGALVLALSAGLAGTATAASYGNFVDPTGTVRYLNVADALIPLTLTPFSCVMSMKMLDVTITDAKPVGSKDWSA